MKEVEVWIGYYIGDEFPDHYGFMIEYTDDNTGPKNPCYKFRFRGESEWIGNIHDEDIAEFPVA